MLIHIEYIYLVHTLICPYHWENTTGNVMFFIIKGIYKHMSAVHFVYKPLLEQKLYYCTVPT